MFVRLSQTVLPKVNFSRLDRFNDFKSSLTPAKVSVLNSMTCKDFLNIARDKDLKLLRIIVKQSKVAQFCQPK